MTEPITLHDAIMALAADITTNDDLPDDTKLRWLEMLVTINAATSRHVLDGLDRLAESLSTALGTVRPTPPRNTEWQAMAEDDDDLGDDFGDEDQFGDGTDNA